MLEKIKNFVFGLFGGNKNIVSLGAGGGNGNPSLSPEASCVAHYKMNDNAASTVVLDSQGYSNGTAQQNTEDLTTDGVVGGALAFNGSGDYVDTGDTFQSVFQGSFSISKWVKPDDGHSTIQSFFTSLADLDDANEEVHMANLFFWSGKLRFDYRANYNLVQARSNNDNFVDGQETWHHIVYVADSTISGVGGLKIYFDGIEVELDPSYNGNTSSVTFSEYLSNNPCYIGAFYNLDTEKFMYLVAGPIDNVMIFNRALNAEEISILYNSGRGTENFQLTQEFSSTGEKLFSEMGV